jgi:hypothetical protein
VSFSILNPISVHQKYRRQAKENKESAAVGDGGE